jgi:hypothetical protein
MHWQTAVRRARLGAARECGPVPPWLYHPTCIYIQYRCPWQACRT